MEDEMHNILLNLNWILLFLTATQKGYDIKLKSIDNNIKAVTGQLDKIIKFMEKYLQDKLYLYQIVGEPDWDFFYKIWTRTFKAIRNTAIETIELSVISKDKELNFLIWVYRTLKEISQTKINDAILQILITFLDNLKDELEPLDDINFDRRNLMPGSQICYTAFC
jgi:hypothetical protein